MSQLTNPFMLLIAILNVEHIPITRIVRILGITQADLSELINRHCNELVEAGIMLHVATASKNSDPNLYIEAGGQRIVSLSRPTGRTNTMAHHINNYLDSLKMTPSELIEIHTNIDTSLAQEPTRELVQIEAERQRF